MRRLSPARLQPWSLDNASTRDTPRRPELERVPTRQARAWPVSVLCNLSVVLLFALLGASDLICAGLYWCR